MFLFTVYKDVGYCYINRWNGENHRDRQLLHGLRLKIHIMCFPLCLCRICSPHPSEGPKAIVLFASASLSLSLPQSSQLFLICCQMKCIHAPMVQHREKKKWTDVETDGRIKRGVEKKKRGYIFNKCDHRLLTDPLSRFDSDICGNVNRS